MFSRFAQIKNFLGPIAGLFLGSLTLSVSQALPPEGLENFGLLGNGQGHSSFALGVGYQNPVWKNDFETVETITSFALDKDLLTIGAKSDAAPKWADRWSVFLRYDFTFLETHSLALKYIHEEWGYISTAKEAWVLDYNAFIPMGEGGGGFYFALGPYYRWLKQRWDAPWSAFWNYNTNDHEWFFQGLMGWKVMMGQSSYFTLDINLRDRFTYYNLDNSGYDLSFTFPNDEIVFQIHSGLRSAALFMGAAQPTDYYLTLNLLWLSGGN